MRLLTGPAGSGKTAFVLERLREALRAGDHAVRLLVPTATLAQHLQNQVAREGFLLRRGLIQTLHGFVEQWAGDAPEAPQEVLYLIVEAAVRRMNRREFAGVAQFPGFCSSLAQTIGEFSAAGCDSARLATHLPEAPLAAAFLAVYQEVDRELERRGLILRAKRLERAAERIEREGTLGIRTIWLDGFHAVPDPELRVIAALGRHAEVTLTLAESDARLHAAGFREERMPRSRPAPVQALVKAPNMEREAEEIARRILEQAAAGRPFREMAIIVRPAEAYVPLLRATLGRFGIPARFYFDEGLEQHATVRFLCGAVDAMLGGWDHAQTLAVLRLAPRFANSNTMDRFEFAVREQIPNAGLGALKALLPLAERLHHLIDSLAGIEEWRSFSLLPKDWAARFRTLHNLFRPSVGQGSDLPTRDGTQILRSQSTALSLFDDALTEAAMALDARHPIGIEPFWRAVKSILRLKPLRLADRRRNVVHVLSAHEARQWVLPVVFICGMVEKQFPQPHPADAYFPDSARCRLNAAGIRVRTAADFDREERSLFESALSRATLLATLSYAEFNARGDRNLPSIYLDDLLLAPQESRAVRPQPRGTPTPPPAAVLRAPDVLEWLRQKTATLSPTALETYLQCPFQYLGRQTLRLKSSPARANARLDFLTQGTIVHEVLKLWYPNPQDIGRLFQEVFNRYLEDKRIPAGYHTERLRYAMGEDLKTFSADQSWLRAGLESRTEQEFQFALDASLTISGKLDRLDVAADGRAWVIDYKYSGTVKDKRKDPDLLQAPVYLAATEKHFRLKPEGVFYVGLKGGVEYVGWSDAPMLGSDPVPPAWAETEARILRAAEEIRGGRVEPHPANVDKCRYCECRDVCRVEIRRAAVEAEGA